MRAIHAGTLALASLPALAGAGEPKLKAEEVLARHVAAIGGAAEHAGRHRNVKGRCRIIAPTGAANSPDSAVGAGSLPGVFAFDSEPQRVQLKMQFSSLNYVGESFAFQGDRAEVGFPHPGRRSALGLFVSANDVILREGLLGGVLNAGWPLLALADRGARVSYDGRKRYDGRELHRLRYRAKKGQGELDVFLYLEPETFRHVASVYKQSQTHVMSADITQSSREPDVYLQLEETFGDYRNWNGRAVPVTWTLRYETQARVTEYWKYDLRVESIDE